ncbi:MAG: DUF4417 domain-containing protein [Paludibacteraceae bacterium]|nr:DUF4417 domain-containing protein [Paludibacteraceae bacterium]
MEKIICKEPKLFDDDSYKKWHSNSELDRVSKTCQRKKTYQNINLSSELNLVGKYELPEVKPYTDDIPMVLTPYTMKDTGDTRGAIHFYVDDYRFTGMYMWGNLAHFTEQVSRYRTVIAPDFSLYLDQSRTLNLFQLYQNRVVTAAWQQQGLNVIPSVSWGNADSFDYCFDGLPKNSVLSLGGLGNAHHPSMLELWEYGVHKTIEQLQPIALIIYGAPKQMDLSVKTYYFKGFINTKFRN